jgi:F-box/leucine-rich repeat protein 10/11
VTALLPSGWIHAVHTPCDSIVYGGNFLTALSLPMSLAVRRIEFVTRATPLSPLPLLRVSDR